MRRRRPNHLQVSTFPFLAVLLCAMGALILVLLVLDRQARLAARARGQEEAKQLAKQAREKAQEQARRQQRQQRERYQQRQRQIREARLAWEKKRAALHDRLVRIQQSLQGERHQVEEHLAQIILQLRTEEDWADHLRQQIASKKEQLTRMREALLKHHKTRKRMTRDAQRIRVSLQKTEREIEELKDLKIKLREAHERTQQTYSVVPYHGKRGANRRPVYIECADKGVIFHPDQLSLSVADEPLQVRKEVHERITQHLERTGRDEGSVYLLVLIRPEGIRNYYRLQAAVNGLDLDFGYELIDSDWLLSFPEDSEPIPDVWKDLARSGKGKRYRGGKGTHTKGGGVGKPGRGVKFPQGRPGGGKALVGSPHRGAHPGATGPGGTSSGRMKGHATQRGAGGPGTRKPSARAHGQQSVRLPAKPSPSTRPPQRKGRPGTTHPPMQQPGKQPTQKSSPSGTSRVAKTPPDPHQKSGRSLPGGTTQGEKGQQRGTSGGSGRGRARRSRRPAWLHGNRDYRIFIECRSDGVLLYPARQRFTLAQLPYRRGVPHPLLLAVQKMIQRRQAGVRPGDAPYRPRIHFLVWPDALRTFHEVYPVLDFLPIPKRLQNLRPGDDVLTIIQGS